MVSWADTAGIVLAGGQSGRYGSPKPFALWRGRPFLTRVAQAVEANSDVLFILIAYGGDIDAYRVLVPDARIRVDPEPRMGPARALAGALDSVEASWVVVAGCDAPGIEGDFLRRLLLHARTANAPAFALTPNGILPTLMAAPARELRHRARTAERLRDYCEGGIAVRVAGEGLNENEPRRQ